MVTVSSSLDGAALVLRVTDNGPGIPPEVLEDIFEPFVTAGKKEGTGLGLAIAQNVIQQHGGSITVESDDRGTTFTMRLPQRDPPAGEETSEEGGSE